MLHRGVEYQIEMIAPRVWKYEFCICAMIRTGKTKCSLELLAIRRVRTTIDRHLRALNSRSSTRMATVLDIQGSKAAPTV